MGTGSMVDFTDPESEAWWRAQAVRALRLGVEGIKADDGEGYYVGEDLRFADGTTGAQSAWRYGGLYRASMQRALDEAHGPGRGVLFGRSGWSGQQATGVLWAGDQASDFWSLRTLVSCTIAAAGSGFSNWSHDVGGYLGQRGVERCPKELLVRWVQLGCFTALMQAHGRLEQEPWTYDPETLALYRGYVLLHEMLNPYVRAAAASAARGGPPIVRPASLLDPGGWEVADAFGFGPALWVAPVVEEGAREREAWLPPGEWIEAWSGGACAAGARCRRRRRCTPIPVWVRAGAIVVTHPAAAVRAGLGEGDAPLHATLWGEPRCGRAARAAGRRHRRALAARALVGARPGRRDLQRARERCEVVRHVVDDAPHDRRAARARAATLGDEPRRGLQRRRLCHRDHAAGARDQARPVGLRASRSRSGGRVAGLPGVRDELPDRRKRVDRPPRPLHPPALHRPRDAAPQPAAADGGGLPALPHRRARPVVRRVRQSRARRGGVLRPHRARHRAAAARAFVRYAASQPELAFALRPTSRRPSRSPQRGWRAALSSVFYGLAILVGLFILPKLAAACYLAVAVRGVFVVGGQGRLGLRWLGMR